MIKNLTYIAIPLILIGLVFLLGREGKSLDDFQEELDQAVQEKVRTFSDKEEKKCFSMQMKMADEIVDSLIQDVALQKFSKIHTVNDGRVKKTKGARSKHSFYSA